MEHVGSTSVPGLSAKPVLDIVATLEKFPLPEAAIHAFGELGYGYRGEAGIPGRQFFRTNPRDRHLHAVGMGSEFFVSQMLFRNFLRSNPQAARRYETLKLDLASRHRTDRASCTDAKGPLIQELLLEARAWEREFGSLRWLQAELEGAPFPWLIAGGWALELHTQSTHQSQMGSFHRSHEDVDVMIYRRDAPELHRFLRARGWWLEKILNARSVPWADGEMLPDDVTQVHAERSDNAAGHLDFLLTPSDGADWHFRRDPRIARPRAMAERVGPHGIPYLAPEIVLLFKSRVARDADGAPRAKDRLDFEHTSPLLEPEPRAWLRATLEQTNPDHVWLGRS